MPVKQARRLIHEAARRSPLAAPRQECFMSASPFSASIIQSLLDTDYYTLTMMQAVLHHYPNAEVEWAFQSRSDEDLTPYLEDIRQQIEALAELQMSAEELAFLERIPYMQPDFIRFL